MHNSPKKRLGSSLVFSVLALSLIFSFTIFLLPTSSVIIVDATSSSNIDERIKERFEHRPTICIGICPTGPPGPPGPQGDKGDTGPPSEVSYLILKEHLIECYQIQPASDQGCSSSTPEDFEISVYRDPSHKLAQFSGSEVGVTFTLSP